MQSHQKRKTRDRGNSRRGATLVVVLALLTMLMFLGFLFYTLAAQDEVNAEYFADSTKNPAVGVSPDVYFNFTLRQIIVGTYPDEYNSALYGGRMSLMATLFGRNTQPFTGQGVNVMLDGGVPAVDQNYDGVSELGNAPLLDINVSPPAQDYPAGQSGVRDLNAYPDPDVPWTYPDINNPFLHYEGFGLDAANNPVRVRLPSFHRPPLVRNVAPFANWYRDPSTKNRMLRPHVEHRAIADDGTITSVPRFVSDTYPDTAPGTPLNPFPFDTTQQGVWSGHGGSYNFDADPSNIGVNDSIYLDLNFPPQAIGSGSELAVALPTIKIVDADALFNLNAHGGANGNLAFSPPFGQGEYISRANQGLGPWEVNPQYGLNAAPSVGPDFSGSLADLATALEQHQLHYGTFPSDRIETSNMEWWWLLTGRGELQDTGGQPSVGDLIVGRWGERDRLYNALQTPLAARSAAQFSWPGLTFNPASLAQADDNRNRNEGGIYSGAPLYPVNFWAWFQPLDLRGSGRVIAPGAAGQEGRVRELAQIGPHRWPVFRDYAVHPQVGWLNTGTYSGVLMPGAMPGYQVDEPAETLIEPAEARNQTTDDIFRADENASLHLSNDDLSLTGTLGRVLKLAPYNFLESERRAEIRRRYTTASWDPKSFNKPFIDPSDFDPVNPNDVQDFDRLRGWEFTELAPGVYEFPPYFPGATNDPFRPVLRELLKLQVGPNAPGIKRPQRRFSINGVLDTDTTGRLRFRPLTPHPNNLGAAPVPFNPALRPEMVSNAAQQEALARLDRQRMARDIYVMLYTFGGPATTDGTNYINYLGDNSSSQRYNAEQLREMAQFAVNLVDALDPDDNITVFEYDKNLANGWNLDDNPWTDDGFTPYQPGDPNYDSRYPQDSAGRGVVYGVERQQLAFSEALAIFAKQVTDVNDNPENHDATEYNDEEHRDFFYVELENVGPEQVTFNNSEWQIVVKPAPGSETFLEERRLTLRPGAGSVQTGTASRFTIGTTGDADNRVDPNDPNSPLLPSFFRVNPWHEDPNNDPMDFITIAPRAHNNPNPNAGYQLDLDLIRSGQDNTYRVTSAPPSGNDWNGDGDRILPNDTNDPAGRDLLAFIPTALDNITGSGAVEIVLELRRRVNPHRTSPVPHDSNPTQHEQQSWDNPWVTVDRTQIPLKVFQINSDDNYLQIQQQLEQLRSRERRQPLFGGPPELNSEAYQPGADDGQFRLNSLGQVNDSTPINGTTGREFTLWQPHFDRDFASAGELFSVPLFGPADLTLLLGSITNQQNNTIGNTNRPRLTGRSLVDGLLRSTVAGDKILHPQGPSFPTDPNNDMTPGPADDNQWHRLLEFMETPSRLHRHQENPGYVVDAGWNPNVPGTPDLRFYRNPGKINLNTLRYPEVLAGLLDDREVLQDINPNSAPPYLPGQTPTRDWWVQFLRARDGYRNPLTGTIEPDPISGLYVPGVPTARPFRSLDFGAHGPASLEHTLLRSLPSDSAGGRRLFELGTSGEHNGSSIDYATKHRLLSKIVNNTTTRSNVFLIFIQIDFFEAKEVTDPATGRQVVRIGAKLLDSPAHRGFFVVDRSKALELLEPEHLPRFHPDPVDPTQQRFTFSFDSSFNYRALVLYQQMIR